MTDEFMKEIEAIMAATKKLREAQDYPQAMEIAVRVWQQLRQEKKNA